MKNGTIEVKKEGSPEWFREQAARKENQKRFKKAMTIREDFLSKYSPDMLAQMSGEELLQKVFGSEDSMLYDLTISKESSYIFGAAAHYKYLWIVYSTEKDTWTYKRGARSRKVTKQEAMQRAREVRDLLVRAASIIENHKPSNSIVDYRFLEKDLDSIYTHSYTWVLKYFQILFPDWFPCMYGDNTLIRALGILGLPEHGERYLNLGEIALFTKKCEIPNVLLSTIYGNRWGWTKEQAPCENAANNWSDSRVSESEYKRGID